MALAGEDRINGGLVDVDFMDDAFYAPYAWECCYFRVGLALGGQGCNI